MSNDPVRRCPHNDCGWCYSKDKQANDTQGACNKPQECAVNIIPTKKID